MSITAGFISEVSSKINDNRETHEFISKFNLPRPLTMKLAFLVDHFLYQLDLPEEILGTSFLLLKNFFPYLSPKNVHRIVFTALVLAYKAFTTKHVKNSTLEKIGVLKTGELGELEKIMIQRVGWNLRYDEIDQTLELLGKAAQDEKQSESQEIEDDDTDFTEGGENDSFSELSAFF
jgi:hypothetical protein